VAYLFDGAKTRAPKVPEQSLKVKPASRSPSSAKNIEVASKIFENFCIPVNLNYGNVRAGF